MSCCSCPLVVSSLLRDPHDYGLAFAAYPDRHLIPARVLLERLKLLFIFTAIGIDYGHPVEQADT